MAPAARQAPLVLTPNRERLGSRSRSHLACSVVTGIITPVPSLTVHALSRTKVLTETSAAHRAELRRAPAAHTRAKGRQRKEGWR